MSEFIKTDVDIAFDIDANAGFSTTDVANMTIRLEKGDFALTKTLNNGVTPYEGSFILSIARTDILTTGPYDLYVRITDQAGKQRGIKLSPKQIEFEKFPINV